MKKHKLARFFLTFFFSWVGSIVINRTRLKPDDYKCNTVAYLCTDLPFFLCGLLAVLEIAVQSIAAMISPEALMTVLKYSVPPHFYTILLIIGAAAWIYRFAAAIMNFRFDPEKPTNIGYKEIV